MRRSTSSTMLAVALTAFLSIGVSPLAMASTEDDQSVQEYDGDGLSIQEYDLGETTVKLDGDGASPSAICVFKSWGDNVHISSSSDTRAVQGHGWWTRISGCPVTQTAKVTVRLQKLYDGVWISTGLPGVATVYAGGGAGKRATAHKDCNGRTSTRYRSVVDVDLTGVQDSPEKLTTDPINRDCG